MAANGKINSALCPVAIRTTFGFVIRVPRHLRSSATPVDGTVRAMASRSPSSAGHWLYQALATTALYYRLTGPNEATSGSGLVVATTTRDVTRFPSILPVDMLRFVVNSLIEIKLRGNALVFFSRHCGITKCGMVQFLHVMWNYLISVTECLCGYDFPLWCLRKRLSVRDVKIF